MDQLVELYPHLYHVVAGPDCDLVLEHGLLSTESLLDLFEVDDARRMRLLSERRAESEVIEHATLGTIVLRDQKPLSVSKLEQCLVDMSVGEWLRLLNSLVFFWPQEGRLVRMLNAPPYRNREHVVLVVDSAGLIEQHHQRIRLSRINSGSTLFNPADRGSMTFQRIEEYDHPERRRPLASCTDIAELAVEGGVPDLERHLVRVERWTGGSSTAHTVRWA